MVRSKGNSMTTDDTSEGRFALPSPCLVILVGPGAAGKSTWARTHFPVDVIVSSDRLRATVGWGEDDIEASDDAFALLEEIVKRRLHRGLSTVIDTLGLNTEQRRHWLSLARAARIPCVAVTFDVPAQQARAQNRNRTHPLPASAMTAQLRVWKSVKGLLQSEGFDILMDAAPARIVPAQIQEAARTPAVQSGSLRFGLHVGQFNFPGGKEATRSALRQIGSAAEEAGFQSLYVMDHFRQIPQIGRAWDDFLESFSTLGYLAAITERIRLGVLVSGITYRNVAHLGKIIATIDVLSGGRAICGLGLAWYRDEHIAYGWDFPTTAQRYELLEDSLQLLPALWGPGSPTFQGTRIAVPEALGYPRPIQERVPIMVGGGGERRTLRLAAKYADMANVMGDVNVAKHKREVLDGHCQAEGRNPKTIELTHLSTALVGRDDAHVAELIEANRRRGVPKTKAAADLNAATVADHIARFRAFANVGVKEAIIRIPNPLDKGVLEEAARVIEAFD